MANWCMNRVEFKADEAQMKILESFFQDMSQKEFETKQGQLPNFAMEESGFMFDIEFEDGILIYQTKWAPNTRVIVRIAEHFRLDFVYNYEEYGMEIFGEVIYANGQLSVIELDHDDLQSYQFDSEKECYLFEGSSYEIVDDIVETLIFRKKQTLNLIQ